ncbi:hypothetical protein EYZ11_006295 [Aspergillus tanneri]|uniref:Uncharacterized protein n=1 Tax=Aspergillus tanneri TaxID=1220188 RepID=A0A4V6RQT7_9EURO|nr:hypothetical protein EYZ11_006295 [Aspergillus tanneri]
MFYIYPSMLPIYLEDDNASVAPDFKK